MKSNLQHKNPTENTKYNMARYGLNIGFCKGLGKTTKPDLLYCLSKKKVITF